MLIRLTSVVMAVVCSFASPADAFWFQHCARTPLTPAELARAFWRG